MADPIGWQLLEAIAQRVRGITVAAGYYTDLGAGRVILDDDDAPEDDAPATIIDGAAITDASATATSTSYDLAITVEFAIPRAAGIANAKKLAHCAAVDLVRALRVHVRELPMGVREFTVTGASLFSANDDGGAAFLISQVTARAALTDTHTPAHP